MHIESLVEGEEPISKRQKEWTSSCHAPETSVVLCGPFEYVLMSSVAEWCVCWHFAVAEFEVTRFRNIKANRSKTGHNPLALAIAEWIQLRVATWAPVIRFTTIQVDVSWINTSISWHASRSVLSLLIRSAFHQVYSSLFGEVGHIVHSFMLSF